MSEGRYRVGVVGCGEISGNHAEVYREHEKTDLVTATDISPQALKRFAETFSVSSTYTNYREMLQNEDLDLVSVCTWHGSHAEVSIAAAQSGVKGIICEKPMTTNLGQAEAMIEASEESGTKLTVEHDKRYHPISVEARRLIRKGEIGRPVLVLARTSDGLLNWGTHMIDHARYLLGDPETEWIMGQVERKTDKYERHVQIEDLCMGLIGFSGGARLVLECDLPIPEFPAEPNSTIIYGSDGILMPTSEELLVLNDKKLGWQKIKPTQDGQRGLLGHLQELIAWIEGRISEHRCSGRQARFTVEIMMGIYESLRTKGLVRTPLKTKDNPLQIMIKEGTLPVEKPGKYDIRIPLPENMLTES